jgi:biopolymer transport protein ExbD
MAFASGGKKGPQTDINVTPLVDVVLVLLIIFMVVTPLLQVDMKADIPKPPEENQPPPPPDAPIQVVIQVKRDGTYVNTDKMANDDMLAERLSTLMKGRQKDDKIAFVTGEETLPFESVIHAMDIASGAGVLNVGIIDPL